MSIWTTAMIRRVNPLRGLELDDWWYRGPKYRSALPSIDQVALLPAGGSWTAEMACHKDYTSFGDKTTESGSEQECCPGSPGLYHSHDDSNNLDESQLGGCALGISDVILSKLAALCSTAFSLTYWHFRRESSIDGTNPIVIFSVQSKCVWTRETTFSIPANMPACSGDYCICSWHWIARQDLPNSYMTGFLCKITDATSAARWSEPQDAIWCGDDPSKCVKGARRPMYAYNTPNNIPFWDENDPNAKRPGYNSNCGWDDGAQDDIFAGGSPGGPISSGQSSSASASNREQRLASYLQTFVRLVLVSIASQFLLRLVLDFRLFRLV
ncbi:hypothetical protein JCM10207_000454 [Rhodosporidiobolus poonsookiae]